VDYIVAILVGLGLVGLGLAELATLITTIYLHGVYPTNPSSFIRR
jgi:hypothetical protein